MAFGDVLQWQKELEVKNVGSASPFYDEVMGNKGYQSPYPAGYFDGNPDRTGKKGGATPRAAQTTTTTYNPFGSDPRGNQYPGGFGAEVSKSPQYGLYGSGTGSSMGQRYVPMTKTVQKFAPYVDAISRGLGQVTQIRESARLKGSMFGSATGKTEALRGADAQKKDNNIDFGKQLGLAVNKGGIMPKEGQPKTFDNYINPTSPSQLPLSYNPDQIKQPWKALPTTVQGDIAGKEAFFANLAPVAARYAIENLSLIHI